MISHCWEQNQGAKGLWRTSALTQLGLQPVNCVSQLQYLIPIPTYPATAHTRKCPQQAVGGSAVLSLKESGSGAKELLRSAGAGARNPPRGSISLQSLAAGPAPWASCGPSCARGVPWLVYPELSIQRSVTLIKELLPQQKKDFVTWVAVFPSSVFSGNLDLGARPSKERK